MEKKNMDHIQLMNYEAIQSKLTGGMDGWAYKPPGGYMTYGCGGVPYGAIMCCIENKIV